MKIQLRFVTGFLNTYSPACHLPLRLPREMIGLPITATERKGTPDQGFHIPDAPSRSDSSQLSPLPSSPPLVVPRLGKRCAPAALAQGPRENQRRRATDNDDPPESGRDASSRLLRVRNSGPLESIS